MNRMDRIAEVVVRGSRQKMAGTWSLPQTPQAAMLIKRVVKVLQRGDSPLVGAKNDVEDALYNLLGDDELFDDLDRQRKYYYQACADSIVSRIKKMAMQKPQDFKNPQMHAMLVELVKSL